MIKKNRANYDPRKKGVRMSDSDPKLVGQRRIPQVANTPELYAAHSQLGDLRGTPNIEPFNNERNSLNSITAAGKPSFQIPQTKPILDNKVLRDQKLQVIQKKKQ